MASCPDKDAELGNDVGRLYSGLGVDRCDSDELGVAEQDLHPVADVLGQGYGNGRSSFMADLSGGRCLKREILLRRRWIQRLITVYGRLLVVIIV